MFYYGKGESSLSKWKKYILITIHLLVVAIIIGFNSTFVVDWLNKSMFVDYQINFDKVKGSFANGTSLIVLFTVLMYAVFGTVIVGVLVTNILFGAFVFANNVKVSERNEFINFSELQTITSPRELLSFIDISLITVSLLILGLLTGLVVLQYFIMKTARKLNFNFHMKVRIGLFIISFALILVVFMQPNVYNQYVLKYEESNRHNFDPLKRAQKDGFLPSFMHTVRPEYMQKPEYYTKSYVKEISEKYTSLAKEINVNRSHSIADSQTIIYLSETLIDPAEIPELLLNETPIPFITEIKKDIGGSMYSQYIGGGTANIEWAILTSFSLEAFNEPMTITPYSDFYVYSQNHQSILSLYDKEKIAIHPFSANLYKRQTVYEELGFDDFLYLNNGIEHTEKLGTHIRVSDESLHKDVLRVAEDEDVGLIHVLSMQNHSPYTGEIPDMKYQPEINFEVFPEEKSAGLFNFLQGIKATDDAVEELIGELDKSERDVNVLLYGDHYPSLFRGLEEKFANQITETPWFIYMNKERGNKNVQFEGLSPSFLVPVLLREGNYFVSPLHGLMDELLTYGVRRVGDDFIVSELGRVDDADLSVEVRELIKDYRIIMFDALFGVNWLSDEFYQIAE